MEYRVIYSIGGRLFAAKGTFSDPAKAITLRDEMIQKGFFADITSNELDHHMHYSPEKLKSFRELESRLEIRAK